MKDIFKNIKVVELANVLAGPAVGMFFSELGASVIKIENKLSGGDVTRQWKLPSESPEEPISAYYASVNWGKKSVFLDLTKENERQKALKIILDADILISNYKIGEDKKLGMDYKSIKKINPQIIYGHITGFGNKSKRVAYDLILQAEAGFMSINGTTQSGPLKMPVAFIDLFAAHQMKEALLVGLINKLKTGKGGYYTVSLFDSALSSLANQGTNWLMENYLAKRIGSLHPNIAPYGEIFKTKDNKEIVLAIGNNKQFKNLCQVLKMPEIANDKKFQSNPSRVKNRKKLEEKLKILFKKFDFNELMPAFETLDVPSGEIKSISQSLSQKNAKRLILKEKHIKTLKTVVFYQDE